MGSLGGHRCGLGVHHWGYDLKQNPPLCWNLCNEMKICESLAILIG